MGIHHVLFVICSLFVLYAVSELTSSSFRKWSTTGQPGLVGRWSL